MIYLSKGGAGADSDLTWIRPCKRSRTLVLGGTDLERGYGDVGPGDPLFTPLLLFARVPFQAKGSVHKTPLLRENLEILASTASIFGSQAPKFAKFQLTSPQIWKFSVHKPPNLEIFSSQAPKFGNFQFTSPLFQRQISVRKPHTSEIRSAHPYLNKS